MRLLKAWYLNKMASEKTTEMLGKKAGLNVSKPDSAAERLLNRACW